MELREWEGGYCDTCNCELQWHATRTCDDDDLTEEAGDDEEDW